MEPTPATARRRWVILALVLAAECMDLLDGTIVNVAAPTIRSSLHASTAALQWMIGGYALAFAVGLVTGGRLGDIYGRRRLFIIGAYGFVAASMACAFAVDTPMLIACRLAQGLAAAILIPQGLGIVRSAFPAEQQATAFGVFGPVIGLSAVLGPILGGVLVDANLFGTGWRMVFLVNLPLGLVAAIGATRLMPESRLARRPSIDLIGTGLVVAATGLLIYPLIQGREAGWPLWTYAIMAAAVALFGVLGRWTGHVRSAGRDPLIEVSVFAHRGYSAGVAMLVVLFAGMVGTMLVLTLYLQFGEGFSAIHAGLTLVPFAVGSVLGATLSAAVLLPRLGRTVLQIACVVQAAGVIWVYLIVQADGLSTSSLDLLAPQLLFGIGLGLLISPLFDFALADVTDEETGSASGALNALQQLAGAIGVAAIGTLFFTTLTHDGFVTAFGRCLLVELVTTPVLLALTLLLPRHAREAETTAPSADVVEASEPALVGAL